MAGDRASGARVPAAAGDARGALESDLVDHLYANLPTILAANLINASIFAVVVASAMPAATVAWWWGLIVAAVAVRGVSCLLYRAAHRVHGGPRVWRRVAIVGASASGLVWGAAGWFFFIPTSPIHFAILAFVLGGMAAGALAASAAVLASFLAFFYPSLLPLFARLVSSDDLANLAMAAMVALFIGGFTLIARRSHDSLVRSFSLRYQHEELTRTLEHRVASRTEELRRHAERQEKVVSFGQRALAADDIEPLCHEAVALVADGLGVEQAAVLRPNAEGDRLEVQCAFGGRCETLAAESIDHERESPSVLAFVSGEVVVTENLDQDDRFRQPPSVGGRQATVRAAASLDAVIGGGGRALGVLHAGSMTPRRFASDDIHFVEAVATMLAAAIEKERALAEVQHMALHDALTGLANRVLFHDHLALALARFRRSGDGVAVVVLDLDNFKDVNDTRGHLAGDRVLSTAARRLVSCVRETDQAARLGGDEFALILSGVRDPANVAVVAAKIIAALSLPFAVDGREADIGVSIGIAICPNDGSDADVLMQHADLALYRAKGRGGNTYEFHQARYSQMPGPMRVVRQEDGKDARPGR